MPNLERVDSLDEEYPPTSHLHYLSQLAYFNSVPALLSFIQLSVSLYYLIVVQGLIMNMYRVSKKRPLSDILSHSFLEVKSLFLK